MPAFPAQGYIEMLRKVNYKYPYAPYTSRGPCLDDAALAKAGMLKRKFRDEVDLEEAGAEDRSHRDMIFGSGLTVWLCLTHGV